MEATLIQIPLNNDIFEDNQNAILTIDIDYWSVQANREMHTFRVPPLFIPNTDTGMDNQLVRCTASEEERWGFVLCNDSELRKQIRALLKLQTIPRKNVDDGASTLTSFFLEA